MKVSISDGLSVEVSIEAHAWSYIKDVKDKLQEKLGVPAIRQRLFYAGRELKNNRTLNDCSIDEGCVVFLASATAERGAFDFISVYGDVPCPPEITDCISQARQGLAIGLTPRLALEGTGGTYFLRNRQKQSVAVFKPEDEEAFMPANPRGYVGHPGQAGFRHGLVSGEGGAREVAAYMLDQPGAGHASVPPTSRVEISIAAFTQSPGAGGKRLSNGINFGFNKQTLPTQSSPKSSAIRSSFSSEQLPSLLLTPSQSAVTDAEFGQQTKIGSLQVYVEFDDLAGDVDYKQFPVDEVHKIAILDIRLFNIDRNEANLLVQKRWPKQTNENENESPSASSKVLAENYQSQSKSNLSNLFSTPNIGGPSHLHHTHSMNRDHDLHQNHFHPTTINGFSPPFKGFTFSPDVSPKTAATSNQSLDSPSLGWSATLLSPDPRQSQVDVDEVDLPPAATFNLNHPPMRAMSDERFITTVDDSRMSTTKRNFNITATSAAIPIPGKTRNNPNNSNLNNNLSTASTLSLSTPSVPPLSSSLPNPPSRLQLRLQALKAARSRQSTVKPTIHLIPIDHANILPDTVNLSDIEWCWLNWPQIHEPLSKELKAWVLNLDVKSDIAVLRNKLSIREECLKVMKISNLWLRKGVENDLTLFEIASLICRSNIDKPSQLEILCAQAATLARSIKDNVKRRNSRDRGNIRTQQNKIIDTSPRIKTIHNNNNGNDSDLENESTSNISLLTSAPTSPVNSLSDSLTIKSSHNENEITPHSSPLSRLLALSARNKSKLNGEICLEECKIDQSANQKENNKILATTQTSAAHSPSLLSSSLSSALSRNLAAVKSNTLPPTHHGKTSINPVSVNVSVIPPAITAIQSDKPTLTRSSSLDLILRRSISFDNFRAVKVKKSGFGTAQITMMGATTEVSDEDTDTDIDSNNSENENENDSNDENHSPTQTSANHHHTNSNSNSSNNGSLKSRATSSAHHSQLNGAAYQVGRVIHMNGESRKLNGWNDESMAQLFFSCLSGLMDTQIQRIKANKEKLKNKQTGNSTNQELNGHAYNSNFPSLTELGSSPMNSLEDLHRSLQFTSRE